MSEPIVLIVEDDPALRAFNAALRPWLHSGTRAHGFAVHHLAARVDNIRYGVPEATDLVEAVLARRAGATAVGGGT